MLTALAADVEGHSWQYEWLPTAAAVALVREGLSHTLAGHDHAESIYIKSAMSKQARILCAEIVRPTGRLKAALGHLTAARDGLDAELARLGVSPHASLLFQPKSFVIFEQDEWVMNQGWSSACGARPF